jgi:two-component system, NarL family, response regulator NreC
MERISILIADDQPVFREGFTLLLSREKELEVVAEASNGEELVALYELHKPQIVITDIMMPVMNGIEASQKIIEMNPAAAIIAFSFYDDEDLILRMVELGAMGYITKNDEKEAVLQAIHCALNQEVFFSNGVSQQIYNIHGVSKGRKQVNDEPELSPRDKKIIRFICEGMTNEQIGEQLYLTKRTIDMYRHQLQTRLGIKTPIEVFRFALKHRICSVGEGFEV